jgi:outer membrane biosynthesis protein TonB
MNGPETAEANDRWKALAGTIIFHGIILIAFLFIVFKNPDPPLYSDNSGVEVNFGYMEDGMGEVQPEPDKQVVTAVQQQRQPEQKQEVEKEIMTQEVEDAQEIAKKEVKKEVKKTPVTITPPKKEVPKQPTVNQSALYKPKKNGGEGETGKTGDQGIEEGSLYTKNYIPRTVETTWAVVITEQEPAHRGMADQAAAGLTSAWQEDPCVYLPKSVISRRSRVKW